MNRTSTRVAANGDRTMNYRKNYRRMVSRKRHMRRKLTIILGIAVLVLLAVLGTSVVTANAKTEQSGYSKEETRYKYYTTVYVTRDMTLWDIADEYITEEYPDKRAYIDEVMEINQLTNDNLSYGSTICVPYYSAEYK